MSRAQVASLSIRLVVAALLLVLFVEGTSFSPDTALPARWADAVRPASAIAFWLFATSVLVSLLDLIVWDRLARRLNGGVALPRLLRDAGAAISYLLTLGLLLSLAFDQPVTALWTASGALSIVLGIALRSIILDLFTGVALSVERSYRIGDWLEIVDRVGSPIYGRVVGMNWRATRLELLDRRVLLVPNSRLGLMMVVNCSVNPTVRAEITVVLDADVPHARATRIIMAGALAIAGENGIQTVPAPRVMVNTTVPGGIEYRVWVWHAPDTPPPVVRSLVLASVLEQIAVACLKTGSRQEVRLVRPAGTSTEAEEGANRIHRRQAVRRVDLFASAMRTSELELLADSMHYRHLRPAEELMVQGQPGASMFVLTEGLMNVLVEKQGQRLAVGKIRAGQIVGEMSLLTGAPRSATVVALTECVLYEISAEFLSEMLVERPALAEAVSEVMAARIAESERANVAEQTSAVDGDSVAGQLLQRMKSFFSRYGSRNRAPETPSKKRVSN